MAKNSFGHVTKPLAEHGFKSHFLIQIVCVLFTESPRGYISKRQLEHWFSLTISTSSNFSKAGVFERFSMAPISYFLIYGQPFRALCITHCAPLYYCFPNYLEQDLLLSHLISFLFTASYIHFENYCAHSENVFRTLRSLAWKQWKSEPN